MSFYFIFYASRFRDRLPGYLVPEFYNITLWPRLKPNPNSNLYIFTGWSAVQFECLEATDLILIHSNKLNYTEMKDEHFVSLTSEGTENIHEKHSTWLQLQTQYLVIQLMGKLTPGQKYQLHAQFTGELADDLAGFYRSEYKEDGVTKIVATSQMHPTNARKTFPCFDEPAIKAVFHLTLIHPTGTIALSNGMEMGKKDWLMLTTFEATEKMSTYLLAIIVSDYAHLILSQGVSGNQIGHWFHIRIWARKKAIKEGQGNYALNVTGPILDFFQAYYNISYPLRKSDQIALPDFYFGAMENWGLVTYRETNLLYDPETSSNSNKETTVTIIAHELAHMWFGNLVTLRWWNEVWLNEGFASYVSYLGADYAEPDWNVKDLIVLDDVQKVFAVDALVSSHPLTSKEDSINLPGQIMEQFDTISYSKVHTANLTSKRYLRHFSYGNTIGSDLWKHLQTAVQDNNVSLPRQVDAIMNRWVRQMGFPVVTIDTSTGIVSQNHFLLVPESNVTVESPYKYEWMIPVRWMKDGATKDIWWLLEKKGVTGPSWVLANINVTGYYRVNYDLGNWERLFSQFNTDHQVIPLINRAQLVDDAFNLASNKEFKLLYIINTNTVSKHFMFPNSIVTHQNVGQCFIYYHSKSALTWRVFSLDLKKLSVSAVLQFSGSFIHPNLRSAVYCSAVAAGGEAEWNFTWSQLQDATVASEANKLMLALACSNNTQLLERYLEFTLDPAKIRKQDATAVITAVANNRAGQNLTWQFVTKNWEHMYGVGSFSFASLISGVTARFSTPQELQQVCDLDFHKDAGFGSAALAVDQALERTQANIKWVQRNKQDVLQWFRSQTGN
uniref:Aminopeptidase n=1 Tax=Xiphophorus couchianus TaxID=32473 RepID=A0A3B5M8L4_9TELE